MSYSSKEIHDQNDLDLLIEYHHSNLAQVAIALNECRVIRNCKLPKGLPLKNFKLEGKEIELVDFSACEVKDFPIQEFEKHSYRRCKFSTQLPTQLPHSKVRKFAATRNRVWAFDDYNAPAGVLSRFANFGRIKN
jgi:hypothetical protein